MLPGSRVRIVRCGGHYDPQLVKCSSEWVSKLKNCRFMLILLQRSFKQWSCLGRQASSYICHVNEQSTQMLLQGHQMWVVWCVGRAGKSCLEIFQKLLSEASDADPPCHGRVEKSVVIFCNNSTVQLFFETTPRYLHLATSEMWCWSGISGILKKNCLSVTVWCTIIMVH